ncbi:MAG: gliding motility-associated ABC transporter substrate-binding protein GldG [Chitinophagaceae bacterium]|nr:gliding motility-associated ABC transporter substrate-binding protein GldG [Chitinophagaceae bacterium]
MKKAMNLKYWWLFVVVAVLAVNWLASIVHYRLDLTSERRYTLSSPTKKLLSSLNDKVNIEVFLSGDMPADFRNLRNGTEELLQEFKENSNNNVVVRFKKPGEGLDDAAKQHVLQYLDSAGIHPTNVKVQSKSGESQEERLVYPGALVTYRDKILPVDLLQGLDMSGGLKSLNAANALLEYKFANAVQKAMEENAPLIGYLEGNGEPLSYNVFDLIERTLKPNYRFGFVPIDSVKTIPQEFNAILIVKPTSRFNDRQKLKLDQYVMHGGRLIWMIDNLYAEMDSLLRSQSDFIAFDRGLNIEDQLFKYGVRINQDLVQDLQCDKLPLAIGNYGDKPQMQLVPWPYFPLLTSYNDNPISKNLNNVLSIFPNSLDTVEAEGIKKTVLLATSENTRTLSTPAIVSLNSVKTEEDVKTFNKKNIPIAVLLEGKFKSLYANRISSAIADTLANIYKQPYLQQAESDNKMIVIADADIVSNVVTQNDGPLQMGTNQFTKTQYANKNFIINAIEYLVNPSGILSARSKTLALRLLDPAKIEDEKLKWQIINVGVPVLLIICFALIYQAVRNKKYTS